jgi:hypothetical protein
LEFKIFNDKSKICKFQRLPTMKKITLTACIIIFAAVSLQADDWGTVRFTGKATDTDGKPLKDAAVLINRVSGTAIGGNGMKGNELSSYMDSLKTLTDASGHYDLSLRYRLTDSTNVECELWFEKKGCVTTEESMDFSPHDRIMEQLDATLQPGLILSGIIRRPETEAHQAEMISVFDVTGENFTNTFTTEKGGAFEICVPPGKYRILVWAVKPLVFNGIEAGTTNLVLQP